MMRSSLVWKLQHGWHPFCFDLHQNRETDREKIMQTRHTIPSLNGGRAWLLSREARRAMQTMGCFVLSAGARGEARLVDAARDELARLARAAVSA